MKWFKHDANAILDSKLKKLKLKYGMEGYGLYWYCLECIARNVEAHNLTFELEEDAELIASDTNIHYERVEEMMRYMVTLKLFEQSNGIITCLKMAARTDEYTQKLLKNNSQLKLSRQYPDSVPIKSELIEEKRTEEKRTEENRTDGGGGEYFDMNYLLSLSVKYLGWTPNLSQKAAESMRPLTKIFKDDVMRGFEAAAANNAKSIQYVIKAAQSKDKSKGALSDEEKRNMNAFLGEEVYQ